jgi:hypothetical protein
MTEQDKQLLLDPQLQAEFAAEGVHIEDGYTLALAADIAGKALQTKPDRKAVKP